MTNEEKIDKIQSVIDHPSNERLVFQRGGLKKCGVGAARDVKSEV